MARSIDDWYSDASGRRGGGPGHDAENDEPVDRTPDSWLDDLHRPQAPEHRRAPRAATPLRGRPDGVTRQTPTSPSATDPATTAELQRAARAILTRRPHLKPRDLRNALRVKLGWPGLSSDRVSEALGSKPGAMLAEDARSAMAKNPGIDSKKLAAHLRERGWVKATPGTVRAALHQKTSATTEAMARKVRALDASRPGWRVAALTAVIRRKGWPAATEADVRAALRGEKTVPSSGPAHRPRPGDAAVDRNTARLVAEVRAYRAKHPRASLAEVGAHVRRVGWPGTTPDDIRQALLGPSRAVSPVVAPSAPPVTPDPDPHRTLDVPARSNTPTCEACGRVISRLGICGCF
ncbi:hypothetical protein KOI35_32380 [Actinoplanes bogorensis]|uniref:Regulatory protein RecX n=1 Tax=Paractinoplanes bogorensis TaxID=1610840 RepID=A0ABS5YXQ4_9ACTN|nr:hypothetical protein [Actinoplanes bogorensis]MBU2668219.1 hypothetical protein [Actinoplanes bogorensis]